MILVATLYGVAQARLYPDTIFIMERLPGGHDALGRTYIIIEGDTLHTSFIPDPFKRTHTGALTNEDVKEIADELGIEPAAIQAVVDIETGTFRSGFYDEGKPVINFDRAVFRKALQRRGINAAKYASNTALLPLNTAKYGSQQLAHQARLDAAMAIDSIAAIESTFWGMFQIGGFNWKLCGAESLQDFVRRMTLSEYDQLQLFANYIVNTGLIDFIQKKNWAAFARIYNGPSYAARGYHNRIAAAYRRRLKESERQ